MPFITVGTRYGIEVVSNAKGKTRIRIRDLVPFGPLDPEYNFFRIPDPTITSESLRTIFWVKIL